MSEFYQFWKEDLSAHPHLVAWLNKVRETHGYEEGHIAFNKFVSFAQNNFAW